MIYFTILKGTATRTVFGYSRFFPHGLRMKATFIPYPGTAWLEQYFPNGENS